MVLEPKLTKEAISRQVAALLDLPYNRRQGKAYQLVKTILRVIVSSLRRGEQVSIAGFGIFGIKTVPARKRLHYFFPYLKKKGLHREIVWVPAKSYVFFRPSKVVLRNLNQEIPC